MTKFEAGKEYKTRDGSRARIYATDGGGEYPIHGACAWSDRLGWASIEWRADGKVKEGWVRGLDLIPPAREWWVFGEKGPRFASRAEAENWKHNYEGEIIHVREVTDE